MGRSVLLPHSLLHYDTILVFLLLGHSQRQSQAACQYSCSKFLRSSSTCKTDKLLSLSSRSNRDHRSITVYLCIGPLIILVFIRYCYPTSPKRQVHLFTRWRPNRRSPVPKPRSKHQYFIGIGRSSPVCVLGCRPWLRWIASSRRL